MPSSIYEFFVKAMVEENQVSCIFERLPRVLSVIILGHTKGEERALAWQTGGQSSKALPGWRCITLSKATDVRLLDSKPQGGARRTGKQTCVADVDLDVNPDSPYRPRRQLEDLRQRGKRR